jgi:hypothetical protein
MERKIGKAHLLEACEAIFKDDGKRAEKAREGEESDERKLSNMHL